MTQKRSKPHARCRFERRCDFLLDGDGFSEVAGLIYVAAAADSDVIGEQLQRHDFKQRQQQLGRFRDEDDMLDQLGDVLLAFDCDGDYAAGAGGNFLDIGQRFFRSATLSLRR